MAQKKVVLKILAMNDPETKQKAMEVVAGIQGVDLVHGNMKGQKLTIIGNMHISAIFNRLQKSRKNELLSVEPAKEGDFAKGKEIVFIV